MRVRLWCVVLLLGFASHTFAESFRVSDIRVEGLQRITAGTVFNYLSVKPGDLVIVRGTLATNVDLGRGYSYKVMLEEATFSPGLE